jgi:hypothetical protein
MMCKQLAEKCMVENHGNAGLINEGYIGDNGLGYPSIDVHVKQKLARVMMQRP